MNPLTPALLRKAANEHLWDGFDGSAEREFCLFSCHAVGYATDDFEEGYCAYGQLLEHIGALTNPGDALGFPFGEKTQNEQSIRFMLLHFLANYLEDEES